MTYYADNDGVLLTPMDQAVTAVGEANGLAGQSSQAILAIVGHGTCLMRCTRTEGRTAWIVQGTPS